MGFLSRKKAESVEAAEEGQDIMSGFSRRLDELEDGIRKLSSQLDGFDKRIKGMPNASDFRLLASEVARLEAELERMESKNKEGMLAMYAQVHKEIRSLRGDRVIEMIDIEPVTEKNLEEASDQLSELARTWRKRRAHPADHP